MYFVVWVKKPYLFKFLMKDVLDPREVGIEKAGKPDLLFGT